MSKSLFEIFEEYFYPQVNIKGDDINADIARYEACYNLLYDLLWDIANMAEQAGSNFRLPNRWEDNLDEYFDECMTAYVMDSDNKSEMSEENADKYIPYEYDYCSKCGERCYYEAYPQAIKNNNGKIVCENCFEEE